MFLPLKNKDFEQEFNQGFNGGPFGGNPFGGGGGGFNINIQDLFNNFAFNRGSQSRQRNFDTTNVQISLIISFISSG